MNRTVWYAARSSIVLPTSRVEILVIRRSRSCSMSLEHLVDAEPGGIYHDRAVGLDKGPSCARRVVVIATFDGRRDLVDIASGLGDAALGAHPRRGREVQLQLGVGEHDRTDVAALEHATAALVRPRSAGASPARRAPRCWLRPR